MTELRIHGAAELARVAADLRKMDRALVTELRRGVRGAAVPITNAVRQAAAAHSRTVARSVTLETRMGPKTAGVSISAKRSKMPAGHEAFPALMEGPGTFRHPVYGNPGTWVSQQAHPFLAPTVEPRLEQVQVAIVGAVDAAARSANL